MKYMQIDGRLRNETISNLRLQIARMKWHLGHTPSTFIRLSLTLLRNPLKGCEIFVLWWRKNQNLKAAGEKIIG
jgi:hypothetical protein